MKRPPGITPAGRPGAGVPPEPEPAATRKPAAAAPRRKSASPTAATRKAAPGAADRTRAEPDATTEPIALPPLSAAGTQPGFGSGSSASDAQTAPSAWSRLTGSRGAGVSGAGSDSGANPDAAGETAAEPPLTARSARARLRAARRARKQYERSEVRRFTSRSRRRRNLWIAAAGTVAALVAFVLVGVFSPLMALRTIEVTGTNRIPASDVIQALDGQLGTPLPLVDLAEVKRELSEFTLIRSYVTESRPPDTLVVRIIEREPVGAIASATGFDLVDAAGVVIQSSADRPAGYPIITATGGASGAGFQAAVAVVWALPEGIRSQLDSVAAATKDDVTLTLTGERGWCGATPNGPSTRPSSSARSS
ncbi:FtsQ-type POTRA domain-containing protein [Cryobacterium sp. PAMC25264]|uniref:FtsQ-type POTRA domain-containing protein n=1 Tax=Cryobacterium sp. PAMC25264 TaxID=2861288 RepID=UPI001C6302DB|nr:FtsQ-type POTRA domain-containing protein [Cryobacterium sp. PAMC25264]QYF74723.1 FtsQ-type POTRA domain-containing protein [Cryobacterium sp. PAMC25264]